jgi:hypothetical protein
MYCITVIINIYLAVLHVKPRSVATWKKEFNHDGMNIGRNVIEWCG